MKYVLSNHVLERAQERGIPTSIIDAILLKPAQIVDDESAGPGHKVYQAVVNYVEKGDYLVLIFVNTNKVPSVVKSVYMTSKISKYDEGEV